MSTNNPHLLHVLLSCSVKILIIQLTGTQFKIAFVVKSDKPKSRQQ